MTKTSLPKRSSQPYVAGGPGWWSGEYVRLVEMSAARHGRGVARQGVGVVPPSSGARGA